MFAQNTGDGTGGSTENKINRLKIVFRPKHIYIYIFFPSLLKMPIRKKTIIL